MSSASTTSSSNLPDSIVNPEVMNKESLLKELNTQKERIAIAKKRKADEMSNLSDKKSNSKRNKNNVDVTKKFEKEKGSGVKYNFTKKKAKFTDKHALQDKELKSKSRESHQGKEKNRESAKTGMSKKRKTDEGKEDNRARFEELLKTPKGKENNRARAKTGMSNLRKTDEGKENNRARFEELLNSKRKRE